MKKAWKTISFILAALLVFTACSMQTPGEPATSAETSATSGTNAQPVKVGFANINEKGSFGKMVRDSMEKEAAKRGYELICVDNNSDGATAVRNADDLITMGIQYMVEFNVDSTVAPVIMEKFDAENIPVVAVDIAHPGAAFFGANNSEAAKIAGRAAAEYAKDNWDGEYDYIVLGIQPMSGPVVAPRVADFPLGFEEVIGESVPAEKLVEIDTQNDTQIAQQRMSDFLMAHPDADRIIVTTINDVVGAGIWAAAETAGRQDDVIVISHNCTADFVEPLYAAKGETGWIGSVAYFPERYGEWIMPIVDKMVAGEEVPEMSYIEHELITWENVAQYYPEGNYPWSKFVVG